MRFKELARSEGVLSLGELIDAIARTESERVEFDFCGFAPEGINSYRGYYEMLAIGYREPDVYGPNRDEVLKTLRSADGAVMHGYKGGDYRMDRDTPVWVAKYGKCRGTAVVGVVDAGYVTIIETRRVEL